MLKILKVVSMILSILIILPLTSVADSVIKKETSSISSAVHPFLVCSESEFDLLRSRALTEPWASMKTDAINRSNNGLQIDWVTKPKEENFSKYIGACALAYILDTENAAIHARRVKDAILIDLDKMIIDENSDWTYCVPPRNELFKTILALDIVYNALSSTDIISCETLIAKKVDLLDNRDGWTLSKDGMKGLWDIYKGIRTTPDNGYYNRVMAEMSADGVTSVATGYSYARFSERVSKWAYMDVLEYTGIDKRYYNNKKLQTFYEWSYSLGYTPFMSAVAIGDTFPSGTIVKDSYSAVYRAGNFSPKAAGYAANIINKMTYHRGDVISFILSKSNDVLTATLPESKLYSDGGGWFKENSFSEESLMGILYNIKSNSEFHTHNETNGLAMSGYGQTLLANGGWMGITDAPSQNTLTVGGNDHVSKVGGGLKEGLTNNSFDYACGLSGASLGQDSNERNLLFIHSEDGNNGYYIVADHVKTQGSKSVASYFHPATTMPLIETHPSAEYSANIQKLSSTNGNEKNTDVKLSLFYATTPNTVNISNSLSHSEGATHKRLMANYKTNDSGLADVLTVVFPYNTTHTKASFNRLSGSSYSGASIKQGSTVTDYTFSSTNTTDIQNQSTIINGKTSYYREKSGMITSYFVSQLSKLSDTYGGIGIHSCADSKHQWENFKLIPNLKLLNLVRPTEVLVEAYESFALHTAQFHSWSGDGSAWTWKDQMPKNSRFVIEANAKTKDDALNMSEKILQSINR